MLAVNGNICTRKRSHTALALVVATAVSLALAAGGVFAALRAARRTASEAGRFVKDFIALEPGRSTFDDAVRVAKAYQNRWEGIPTDQGLPSGCNWGRCDLAFIFENSWLHHLRLAPPTALYASVHISEGVVTSHYVLFGSAGEKMPFFEVMVTESRTVPPGEARRVRTLKRNTWQEVIELTPDATVSQREQAYAFNLSCLSKIGGCRTRDELLLPHSEQKSR